MLEEEQIQIDSEHIKELLEESPTQQIEKVSIPCPYRMLTGHWLTLSRPQYKRTCGISSLVSIWNYQFSRLGLGTKEPICIEQAMLKLNLIGNGSVEENFRKKFKKTAELTEKNENENPNDKGDGLEQAEEEDPQIINNDKTLHQYIDTVDFGCFTGNDTLLKWYRLLCRIYGGSGRSYIFYKTNSERSKFQDELSAKKGLVEGLNSKGQICFIYHAYDHYFCPVGYEYSPANEEEECDEGEFMSGDITQEGNLCVLVGESSKMFPCIHSFDWNDIQKDLTTYWPKKFNIRRPKQGITIAKGKQEAESKNSTINCIMAFEKLRD